jgi:hypothetical protein
MRGLRERGMRESEGKGFLECAFQGVCFAFCKA